ncbi:hypothetical protein SDC9_212812 [bioreactor metagenome]|uniref:Uncharacterized protein n=1 Tax=bioreactor metagenome TaxID=1076179 RepID=A0A645K1S3_9ZZZZ
MYIFVFIEFLVYVKFISFGSYIAYCGLCGFLHNIAHITREKKPAIATHGVRFD